MKKILITGASGMLGSQLAKYFRNKADLFLFCKDGFYQNKKVNVFSFDLRSNSIESNINAIDPDIIIHCAALTNVDYCEFNQDEAIEVNSNIVGRIKESAPNAKIIYISSDAVFADNMPFATEVDNTNPLNAYGKSKLLGESFLDLNKDIVIRTTIIGKNINPNKISFCEWIINNIKADKAVNLFSDSLFNPITIWDISLEIEYLINSELTGIYNICGTEAYSKYTLGSELSRKMGLNQSLINSVKMFNMEFAAKRSIDQTLDPSKYIKDSGRNLPDLESTVGSLIQRFL